MTRYVNDSDLLQFVQDVFSSFGISRENALICADNLVLADLRGVSSHGVARLRRMWTAYQRHTLPTLTQVVPKPRPPATATAGGLGRTQGISQHRQRLKKPKKPASALSRCAIRITTASRATIRR